ncbi:MAG: MOSC domain-containing protein [Planctomycetia bacterium]|nr:MOSC domain-containing protein [Planctomycetia bacterium]
MTQSVGKITGIALRTSRSGPMREVVSVQAVPGGGLVGDHGGRGERGLTLLSAERWRQVVEELKTDLPWHTRRANVLVAGLDLAALIGKRVRLGEAEIVVRGETDPCGETERQFAGLQEALVPDCRGGVFGRIVVGGTVRVGDDVEEIAAP